MSAFYIMITLNARDVCLSLGVYAKKGEDELLRRKVRDYLGLELNAFVDSVASDYSKNFKPLAIADFEIERGGDLLEADYSINSSIGIKSDGIFEDVICMFFCEYSKKDVTEFAESSQKIKVYCQYAMYVANKKSCYCIQWNSNTSKTELIKLDKVFIERTLPIIEEFISFINYSILNDSDRHIADIDDSKAALSLAELHQKNKLDLELILNKIDRIEKNIVERSKEKEKQNIGGLLVTKTNNGYVIS